MSAVPQRRSVLQGDTAPGRRDGKQRGASSHRSNACVAWSQHGPPEVMGVSLVTDNQLLCHTQADADEVAQGCPLPPPIVEHGAWPGKTNLEIGRWDTRVRRGLETGL